MTRPTALYLRVSTKGQAGDDRFGLAAQQAAAEAYAQRNDLRITRIYQDTISGSKEERDGLRALRNAAASYEVVLISAIDRLARDIGISLGVLGMLGETGLEVHSADMGLIDMKDESSTLNYLFRGSFSHYEAMRIKNRLRSGMVAKVRAGKPVVPPNGFGWQKGEILEAEAQWVREMYRWAREGWSAHQIVTELNRLGVPRRTGARWTHSTVKYMLRNALYKGEYSHGRARPGRGDGHLLVTCSVEAIVPPEEWEATQRALASRQKGGRAHTRPDIEEFPLAKRLHCGICGGTLSASTNYPHKARPLQKTPYRFYYCYRIYRRDGYWGEPCTHRRYYGVKKVHPFILEQLQALLSDENALQKAVQHAPAPPVDVGPAIATIDKRLERLKTYLLDGTIPPEEYKADRAHLEAQKTALLESASTATTAPSLNDTRARLRQALTLDNLGAVVRALDLHATIHPDGRVDLQLLAL